MIPFVLRNCSTKAPNQLPVDRAGALNDDFAREITQVFAIHSSGTKGLYQLHR
jgi:hypothetical protein